MRIMSCGLFVLLYISSLAWAEEQTAARAIIDKAIQAAGGEDKLAKLKASTFNEKGTYYGGGGDGQPYTGKYAFQLPDRFRMEIEGIFTIVVAPDRGWIKSQEGTVEMTKEQLAGQHQNLYGGYVAHLTPLKNKAFTLSVLPEIKIEGKPALGVKVSHKGKPDVILYFDKGTGLLAKSEYPVQTMGPMAKEAKEETFFSDYKEMQGIKAPTKMVIHHDGKRFVDGVISDLKYSEKLDDSTFAKP